MSFRGEFCTAVMDENPHVLQEFGQPGNVLELTYAPGTMIHKIGAFSCKKRGIVLRGEMTVRFSDMAPPCEWDNVIRRRLYTTAFMYTKATVEMMFSRDDDRADHVDVERQLSDIRQVLFIIPNWHYTGLWTDSNVHIQFCVAADKEDKLRSVSFSPREKVTMELFSLAFAPPMTFRRAEPDLDSC
jgi:hypothetical protein